MSFSLYKIISYLLNGKEITNTLNNIEESTVVEETINPDNEETTITKEDPYWDFIKMNLINVDLTELKKQNKDTVGWIQIKSTNINYPFVQTTNNDYYLTHQFNKKYNAAGWIFMDYRNNIKNTNEKNTILYGHSMLNKSMFGTLSEMFKSSWLKDKSNYIINISTESENTIWAVFSMYTIEDTTDYIQTSFFDDEEYQKFLNMIKDRSKYNFNVSLSPSDRILTLSTCHTNNNRRVVHAKLIKRELKQ